MCLLCYIHAFHFISKTKLPENTGTKLRFGAGSVADLDNKMLCRRQVLKAIARVPGLVESPCIQG